MSSKILCSLILLFIFNRIIIAQNQSHNNTIEKIDIQCITLKNKGIEEAIKVFIKRIENQNQLFKNGFGFLSISNIQIGSKMRPIRIEEWSRIKNDTILKFDININSYILLEKFEPDGFMSDNYPPFYTFIDGRLILLYDDIFDTYITGNHAFVNMDVFTENSMKKLREAMFPYFKLALNEDFEFKDILGQKSKLDREQRLKMSQTEIFKKASFVFDIPSQKVHILRDGRILYY